MYAITQTLMCSKLSINGHLPNCLWTHEHFYCEGYRRGTVFFTKVTAPCFDSENYRCLIKKAHMIKITVNEGSHRLKQDHNTQGETLLSNRNMLTVPSLLKYISAPHPQIKKCISEKPKCGIHQCRLNKRVSV